MRKDEVIYAIKSKATGRYLANFNKWTDDVSEALCFPNGLSVVLHVAQHRIGQIDDDIEIIPVPILAPI